MARSHLARIRRICLSLPEAVEVEAWGSPTFRIGKIFVMYAEPDNGHGGREGIWIKTDHFTQDLLVRGQPSLYFSPPYVGPQGWTGAYLNADTDWIAVTELVRDAYRATAPRRLAALVPDEDMPPVKRPRRGTRSMKTAVRKTVKKAVKKAVKNTVKKPVKNRVKKTVKAVKAVNRTVKAVLKRAARRTTPRRRKQ